MRRKLLTVIITTIVIVVLFLWSPWINVGYAKMRAVAEFERTWLNVADGCGFACHGCGAVGTKKVAFGMQVTLEYACGMLPADSSNYHQQADVFVSFLGKAYGLPSP